MSVAPPRRAVSEQTRAAILRAAAELFFAKGYEATTIRELAAALRIKSASIYYHFEDKEQILFELVSSTLARSLGGIRAMLEREGEHERRLAGVVVHHVVMNALRPMEATLSETELRSLTAPRREQVLAQRDEHVALIVGVLVEGARAGVFELLDPKLTAYAAIAECNHVGTWFRPDGRLPLGEVAHAYAGLAVRMAGGPPVPERVTGRLAEEARREYGATPEPAT